MRTDMCGGSSYSVQKLGEAASSESFGACPGVFGDMHSGCHGRY